ncbi:nucleotidyltransferase substrate binding protein [Deferribacteraceae bacterium V6Fe1]|uniref:HI0074 family nucleotidyltransferase substrate-binding subunit n=1 Tax=Deferrivibrio essentukiensis TaxID=2880922 RepID=UPI001F622881|nr:HI0074 family nucleotidyltransferase substrate-binding subunit [Deferrivibrio essentukiensis]MCB4205311.1 nucleotidyltransferase substrate binding protein [Deferrivibrio essentukiensis]UOD35597.1 nucleotidyltransferase substrate binding protein [Deferribacteraceae bacterium V6Fe1]
MKKSDVLLKIQNFENALERLTESIKIAQGELEKDGVIQRFEFTIELLWKALKALLSYEGIECNSPRNCIKEAFKAGIISDNEVILDMIEDRNLSSHIYNQTTSEEIFLRIKSTYVDYLNSLKLKNKLI